MTDIYGYATAAPLYRAAGWMQVIPLPEGRKTPPPSGFTGRSRKPVTDEQVQVWSQATPDANTGIVIPEGVLVLDIDAAQGHQVKADGAKGISELSQELGMLPATWSSTAHGIDSPARHLFYKVPEGLAWKGGAIEGVDILQPGHRYSVVWPSIHPSGEMYCWYTPSGRVASTLPRISDLATLPWKWVDYLRKPDSMANLTHSNPSTTPIASNPRGYDDRMCKAVNTFLNKTLANPASKGSRHDTTLQAVWALVNFAQEGHRGALDAINQLKPRFIAEVAPDRQGKEREAAREWASILSGAMEKVNGVQSHVDPCEQSKIERMTPASSTNSPKTRLRIKWRKVTRKQFKTLEQCRFKPVQHPSHRFKTVQWKVTRQVKTPPPAGSSKTSPSSLPALNCRPHPPCSNEKTDKGSSTGERSTTCTANPAAAKA